MYNFFERSKFQIVNQNNPTSTALTGPNSQPKTPSVGQGDALPIKLPAKVSTGAAEAKHTNILGLLSEMDSLAELKGLNLEAFAATFSALAKPVFSALLTCRDHWETSWKSERETTKRLRRSVYSLHNTADPAVKPCHCYDCNLTRQHGEFSPPDDNSAQAPDLLRQRDELRSALEAISNAAGNLSDDAYLSQCGPNDGAGRGIILTGMRSIARQALANCQP